MARGPDDLVAARFAEHPDVLRAELSLHEFVKQAWHVLHPTQPFTDGWAVRAVCEHLQAVTEGDIDRLLINVPPGCTKSMTTNVMWPAWEWGPYGRPDMQYINASYDEKLATRDMLYCRDLISSEWYQARWPIEWKSDDRGKTKYSNTKRGFRYACGVAGNVMGWRGQRFIIDDPHNTKSAESEADRHAATSWFTEATPSRFTDPKKPVYVIIMQRLHVDDISGVVVARLLEEQGWTHLCLPMEFEPRYRCFTSVKPLHHRAEPVRMSRVKEEGDALAHWVPDDDGVLVYSQDPRTEDGELLWPERHDSEAVRLLKAQLMVEGGEYAVAGQLQQRPIPREGGMFKVDRIQVVDRLPEGLGGTWVRGWDLAGTGYRPGERKSKRAAWTVGALLFLDHDGTLWVADVVRGRWEPEEVLVQIVTTAERDGFGVTQSIPQDPGQAGKHQVTSYAKALQGFDVVFSPESGDKDLRATPFSAQVNAGNVRMIAAEWNGPLLAELGLFPGSTWKDQTDALSRAYAELLKHHRQDITTSFGVKVIR